MQSDVYMNSKVILETIQEIIKGKDDYTDNQIIQSIKSMILDAFNAGRISCMEDREKLSKETLQKKSKEVTQFLPANFKKTETSKQLVNTVQETILANSEDYVLNVGYEPIVEDTINKVLQIAYAIGITTGFEIASDPDMKSIYSANVERFMKSGLSGNK